jgi:hypothetical protein
MTSRKTASLSRSSRPIPFHWQPIPEKTNAIFLVDGGALNFWLLFIE